MVTSPLPCGQSLTRMWPLWVHSLAWPFFFFWFPLCESSPFSRLDWTWTVLRQRLMITFAANGNWTMNCPSIKSKVNIRICFHISTWSVCVCVGGRVCNKHHLLSLWYVPPLAWVMWFIYPFIHSLWLCIHVFSTDLVQVRSGCIGYGFGRGHQFGVDSFVAALWWWFDLNICYSNHTKYV